MKYVVFQGDGMADAPLGALGGRTPLQAARTPAMDRLAREGVAGMIRTLPPGLPKGSDVANLSILGYDPTLYYTGRAPLEAASRGIVLGPDEVVFRCNLVTLDRAGDDPAAWSMADYSAGHIPTAEARELIAALDRALGGAGRRFVPGVSYRHLLIARGLAAQAACTPPHDMPGQRLGPHRPRGEGSEELWALTMGSWPVLADHPINRGRLARGERPANSIWLWGQGAAPALPPFRERFGLGGAMVSAVDLLKGLGRAVGFEVIEVPGATGYLDTNCEGKAEAALQALARHDLAFVHFEAPDECGHNGDLAGKVEAIEMFDRRIIGPVTDAVRARFPAHRVLLLCDHPTPVAVRTHVDDPVPFVLSPWPGAGARPPRYAEGCAAGSALRFDAGHELMGFFLRGEGGAGRARWPPGSRSR
jgi:2,3-bisphosphoglycerate-independent phosphoglycerate mutase